MLLTIKCPFCGNESSIQVDDKAYEAWQNGKNIQEAFPNLDVFARELLISSMCYSCQEKTFHRPLPWNEAAWGKLVRECDCCGAPVYEIDKGVCAQCGATEEDG